MERLFLVTHAEATHHLEDRVGGWYDSDLTATGHAQAQQVAVDLFNRVEGTPRIYSSDLKRAVQTATPIGEVFSTGIQLEPDLREVSCGIAEGRPNAWLDERIVPPPLTGNRLDHQICEGAESRRRAANRIYRFVDSIMAAHKETAIVVSHGFATSFAIAAWLGVPIETLGNAKFRLSSASITELDFDRQWGDRRLVSLNVPVSARHVE